MVSFSKLGNFGRLGNSLFQIAVTIAYANKHNMEYIFPKWQNFSAFKHKFNQYDILPILPIYKEGVFSYNEIPKWKDIDLYGYFQSEKYFKHCEKEIRQMFEPNDAIKQKVSAYKYILKKETCAIHIRRTDYLQLSKYHTNLSLHYYNTAISKIKADYYLIFSDDTEWCKTKIKGENVIYINTGDDIVDFFIMAECKNFIIANSSFSWWASYLAKHPKKRIIAPRKKEWFGEEKKDKNVDDLYFQSWEENIKSAVIIFHKNVNNYPKEWVEQCINSIKNQTYKNFDVFEIDYGGTGTQIYPNSKFESKEFKDHAKAHNYLLDKAFKKGYDCVFNTNVDDVYALDRFEKQLKYIEEGYDVVSSNFYHINENTEITHTLQLHDKDILAESNKNNNIIAHPVLCYSKNFWTTCTHLQSEQIPRDDFELWKRSYQSGQYKFIILPDYLLYYRVHSQKASAKENQYLWK